jgi:hypothetical protein
MAACSRALVGVAGSRLGQHDQPFGAALGVGRAERGHAAFAHAVDRADRVLDLLRVEVAAAADDDVFHAPRDVHLAGGDIRAISGVEPAVVDEPRGFLRIAEVALRGRRAAEMQVPLDPLADFAVGVVDDADRVKHRQQRVLDRSVRIRREGVHVPAPGRFAAAAASDAIASACGAGAR